MADETTERRQIRLRDMKRTKSEKKEREMAPSSPMDSDYHYGLRLHRGDEEMDKVGMKDMPKHGDHFVILGHAKVTRAEESTDERGKRRNVEMHIVKLGMKPKGDEDEKGIRGEIEDAVERSQKKGSDAGGSAKDRKGEAGKVS